MSKILSHLRQNESIKSCNAFGEFHHITFKNDTETAHKNLISSLEKQGHSRIEMKLITPTIEDCFINLMTE